MSREKSLLLFAASVAVIFTVFTLLNSAYVSDSSEGDEDSFSNFSKDSDKVRTTPDGTKYTVAPDTLVRGCPGIDCIPSIDDPEFVEAGEAEWLESDDRVIGLEIDGESRAYPLKILSRHEIVNDRVSGKPVVVTYCPLCRSGVTYSRKLNGEILEFGVSGKLHNANLVMYDRSTESYWNQISGNAIVGEKVPQELELIFSSITTWGEWKNGHQNTDVLSRDTGIYPLGTYEADSYRGYKNSETVGFGVDEVDDRLDSKELVYGLKIDDKSKAYPEISLKKENIIVDEIENKTVLVFRRPDDGTVTSLVKADEGREYDMKAENIEDSKENKWTFSGKQINGNESMKEMVPQGFYWFAWSKFNPETQVYNKR